MRISLALTLLLTSSLFLLSCTREIDQDTVNISLNFDAFNKKVSQSVGSQSFTPPPNGFYPAHLVANIHFDGQTEIFQWDCKNNAISNCAFPSNVGFARSFPNGEGRVAQVLLVYENERSDLLFYYSHALDLNFHGGEVDVVLNNWQDSGVSPGIGTVAGKMQTATALAKTGIVVGSFEPIRPTGYTAAEIPAVKVFEEYMVGGWFEFHFFRGIQFTYKLYNSNQPQGLILFENKNFEYFASLIDATHAGIHIKRPAHYSVHPNQDGTSWHMEGKENREIILAFFDLNQSIKTISQAGNDLRVFEEAPTNSTYSNNFLSILNNEITPPLNISGNWVDPADPSLEGNQGDPSNNTISSDWSGLELVWNGATAATDRIYKVGGSTEGTATTSTSAIFTENSTNYIKLFTEALVMEPIPFRSVYQQIKTTGSPNHYDYLKVIPNASNYDLTWEYIPNLSGTDPATAPVQGTTFILTDRQYMESADDKLFPCPELASGNIPATFISHIAAGTTSASFPQSIVSGSSFSEPLIIACPYSEVGGIKKYYPTGVEGHIGNGPVAASLNIAGNNTITENSCEAYIVSITSPSGANRMVNINSGGLGEFYSDSGCSSPLSASINVTEGSPMAIYYKAMVGMNITGHPLVFDIPSETSLSYPVDINDVMKLIFVTSSSYSGNLGGLSGADSTCNSLASSAGLNMNFKAVLSDNTTDASSRFTSSLPIHLNDSVQSFFVSNSTTFFNAASAALTIDFNETGGNTSAVDVWTGSTNTGTKASDTCNNWSDASATYSGQFGLNSSGANGDYLSSNATTCDNSKHLYCLEE